MSSLTFVYLIVICFLLANAYVNDSYWIIVQNNQIQSDFRLASFHKHPRRNGQKLNFSSPALYLQNNNLIFGQAEMNQNGTYCASFNVDSETTHKCTHFRILKSPDEQINKYYLIKPELFDPFLDDPVGFDDKFLVIVYDYYSDSSFFGTLHRPIDKRYEPVVYAVDYHNSPTEIRGVRATSNGDFILFVVRQRPFFHPIFDGLCHPFHDNQQIAEAEHKYDNN